MEYINSIGDLEEIINKEEEVVLYGAGWVTKCVMQYLVQTLQKNRISCIAVQNREGNPVHIEDIPVFPLSSLGHYRHIGCFVVSTMPDKHEEINDILTNFGCGKILFLSLSVVKFLDCTPMHKGLNCGDREREITKLTEKVRLLERRVFEQNELCHLHTEAFETYRNCNRGKDVVVLATGPTMKKYSPIEGAIHIGVNGAWKRQDISLDYYFVQDGTRNVLEKTTEGLRSGSINCPIFIGSFSERDTVDACVTFPEEYFIGDNIHKYISLPQEYWMEDLGRDIRFHYLADGGSVVFPAFHFALYTYPKRIYLVGCDTSGTGYFEPSDIKSNIKHAFRYIRRGYARMKTFADLCYPQTEIISVNPVGLKGLFRDITME